MSLTLEVGITLGISLSLQGTAHYAIIATKFSGARPKDVPL
ncbi:hypothetical protein EDD73_11718 [Heliophilum fasciatum]|uniref:Uncharacterized protein n=1 Tax=Heliophilum fasciatum TaxID=35700 RepID=A0A4R2RKG6_9FIRM|nr:hypothetical protein EDD73_11718 [Heliophilum fasciatum]